MTDSDRTGISGLSDEQWATLLTMLNSHKSGANERLTSKKNILPLGLLTQGFRIT